jgi:hypothetical protein
MGGKMHQSDSSSHHTASMPLHLEAKASQERQGHPRTRVAFVQTVLMAHGAAIGFGPFLLQP